MVKSMYKEIAKSKVNPLLATAAWLVGTYAFVVLWGIAQIVFEFSLEALKAAFCLAGTVWFGWYLITRLLTEYEFILDGGKLTIVKVLSKRSAPVQMVASDNICAICESKEKYKKYDVKKLKSYTRPRQDGKAVYVVYKRNDELWALKLKISRQFMAELKKGNKQQ